ncbi:hypothetical protein ABEB36_008032 [Hypothenemus hampei]|uniref:Myb/SANT-like DNA-binding domain-containing protein n=1 Tax=Hypothenemus hampei TaxID=57062 RepID=A0ABD1EKH0_HYPHA
MSEEEVIEFVIMPDTSTSKEYAIENSDSFKWSHVNTLALIDLYKKYRKDVGSFKIRTLKKMFEEIACQLELTLKQKITASNCENRWKHLERTYKKYVENNNKTGRGRKDFEYATEMNDVLGQKKNVNPIILLSSDTVVQPKEKENNRNTEEKVLNTKFEDTDCPITVQQEKTSCSNAKVVELENPLYRSRNKKEYRNKILKVDILREIRKERQRIL